MDAVINFFTKMSKENKLVLAFCLIVILCTLYRDCVLCKYVPKLDGFRMTREGFESEKEGFGVSRPSMVLFYAPWCPHCKSMMDDWDKLQEQAGSEVEVVKVNCDEKPEMAEQYDVKGFPTIILFKEGKQVNFEGSRNLDNFLEFLRNN
jgi:protein disulfide-isomerase-like protein